MRSVIDMALTREEILDYAEKVIDPNKCDILQKDCKILEYMFDKRNGGKKILKDILYDIVPREILERPKHGFAAPVGEWFRSSLKEQFVDVINKNDIIYYCTELDADKLINYRDKFLQSEKDTLCETSFFKLFIYLQWIKLHSK